MQKIPENWRKSSFTIIEAGRLINQQHKALPYPDFLKWVDDQPLGSKSTAMKVAAISQHPILGDAAYTGRLPSNWGKLYEASFLPDVFLRDKINNGGIETISRFDIYKIRNRPTRKVPGKLRTSPGAILRVPRGFGYKKVSDWIRAGIRWETEKRVGMADAAKAISMSKDSYGRGRMVIMIHDRNDLNADDRKLAEAAVQEMDETHKVSKPLELVQPILTKIYGADRRGINMSDEKRRKEIFANAISVICDTCFSAVDVKIPFMGKTETTAVVNQLLDAVESLSKLVNNIRRSGND